MDSAQYLIKVECADKFCTQCGKTHENLEKDKCQIFSDQLGVEIYESPIQKLKVMIDCITDILGALFWVRFLVML